jgi:hypothetical protein
VSFILAAIGRFLFKEDPTMKTNIKKSMLTMLAILATAAPAMAGEFNFQLNINRASHHGSGLSLGISTGTHRPVIPVKRIWVAPVYETVVQRVWVPTVETAYRDVPVTNIFGQVISYRREPYTIESGYWTEVHKQVLVRAGYWTTTPIRPRLHHSAATVAVHRTRHTGHRASVTHNTLQNHRRPQPVINPRAHNASKYKKGRKLQQAIQRAGNLRELVRTLARNR